ncbi:MAG: translation elongation factor Ts [Alphaproteobacteria bacterium]
MANITAGMVKDLREKTGAGMMDCKAALNETGGDMDAAVDWLRKKGIAKAAKKAGRVAAEGLIGVAVADGKGAVVEVNSETDFVARNETFQTMVRDIARVALEAGGDIEKVSAANYPGTDKTVSDYVTETVGTIGENLSLRRAAALEASPGVVVSYIHNAAGEGLGKIGVLVALESEGDRDKLKELGRQLAMHVAAAAPLALRAEDLDPQVVEREKAIFGEQARASGKPDNIVEKMVEGRLRKFYEEVALMNQTFVIDGESKIEQVVEKAAGDVGAPVRLAGFVRFALGEGIDKGADDFASEVAAAASA